jgi:hypothetical protein
MKPASSHEVTFGNTGGETVNDEGALRQQELVDEICGSLLGSWTIWFPAR